MAKPRLYVCRWADAHFASEEVTMEEAGKRHKAVHYWSAGILVKSDESGVTLAMDYGLPLEDTDSHSWRTRSFIPRALIELEFDAGPLLRTPKKPKTPPKGVDNLPQTGV